MSNAISTYTSQATGGDPYQLRIWCLRSLYIKLLSYSEDDKALAPSRLLFFFFFLSIQTSLPAKTALQRPIPSMRSHELFFLFWFYQMRPAEHAFKRQFPSMPTRSYLLINTASSWHATGREFFGETNFHRVINWSSSAAAGDHSGATEPTQSTKQAIPYRSILSNAKAVHNKV